MRNNSLDKIMLADLSNLTSSSKTADRLRGLCSYDRWRDSPCYTASYHGAVSCWHWGPQRLEHAWLGEAWSPAAWGRPASNRVGYQPFAPWGPGEKPASARSCTSRIPESSCIYVLISEVWVLREFTLCVNCLGWKKMSGVVVFYLNSLLGCISLRFIALHKS